MPIKQYQAAGGLKNSKALAVGEGFATGGPLGGLLALGGVNNPNLAGVSKLAGAIGGASNTPSVDKGGLGHEFNEQASSPVLGAEGGAEQGPMGRRLSVLGDQNHAGHIDLGIEALDHPDVPHELRMAAAPVLFAAKHYGTRGLTPSPHVFGEGEEESSNQASW